MRRRVTDSMPLGLTIRQLRCIRDINSPLYCSCFCAIPFTVVDRLPSKSQDTRLSSKELLLHTWHLKGSALGAFEMKVVANCLFMLS